MTPQYLSVVWVAIASAMGNHLWQSTIFVCVAGLLALILRRNHARARYWLWFAATVKFLVPFSLLAAVGSHLAWSRGYAGSKAGLSFAMEEISAPLTQPSVATISRTVFSTISQNLIHLLPTLVAAVWLCGFVAVLLGWCVRWRRISATIRQSATLRAGREVDALQKLQVINGMPKHVEIQMSKSSLEPGIFGIVRPVLIWPKGISEHLEDAHIEAIMAHELWHVRRQDNLAAAMHMMVEAIFWFYPLVWWLGARLVAERERACDEKVLELGSERHVYAESILKICEFCAGSPLACVSGVTGADLQKRIARIMTERVARELNFGRKLILSAAGLAAVGIPVVFGLLNTGQIQAKSPEQDSSAAPAYQVVSIKPNKSVGTRQMQRFMFSQQGFTATNISLQMLIRDAYGVEDDRILGAPTWLSSEKYDIEAKKVGDSAPDELHKLTDDQRELETQRMLQALLADRFKLTLHHETTELSVYALVVAENGPKLREAKPGDTYPDGFSLPTKGLPPGGEGILLVGPGKLTGQGLRMSSLVRDLSQRLGHTVLDKTGLAGHYDFTLRWTPVQSSTAAGSQQGIGSAESSAFPIFTAIQDQLGLKLEPQETPMEILVIDHAEQPSEN